MRHVKIVSIQNGKYLTSNKKVLNEIIYAAGNSSNALIFSQNEDGSFSLKDNPKLFLSYRSNSGLVKLYDTNDEAQYTISPAPTGAPSQVTILNNYHKQYMWLPFDIPYVSGKAPKNAQSWWYLEPI